MGTAATASATMKVCNVFEAIDLSQHTKVRVITAHFVTHFRASLTTATTVYLTGKAFPMSSLLLHSDRPEPYTLLSVV